MVKLVGLKIDKMHGYFNYDVSFNSDITFLYGDNGCGKTTILNIITYIITGKIYELFQYDFKEIILKYSSDKTDSVDNIIISHEGNDIKVIFLNQIDLIESQRYENSERKLEIERYYLSQYPILNEIKDTFNYVYLPLNRDGNIANDFLTIEKSASYRRRYISNIDVTLHDVESLVRRSYNRVNFILNKINEKFSNDILKSFLDVENSSNVEQLIKYINKLDSDQVKKIQEDYANVLKTINKWDNKTETRINYFFESLEKDIKEAEKTNVGFSIEVLFKLSELVKINSIISKAEESEQSKKKHKQPVNDFVKTVNKFIGNNSVKKEIIIDTDGTINLKTHGNKVDIQHLSSGEKQIVTFFAYLIFGLENTNQSIFIVDEPELSLHLNWQRQFVDSIMSVNKNVQLIFATHAPEIIGKHLDKCVKLIPNM